MKKNCYLKRLYISLGVFCVFWPFQACSPSLPQKRLGDSGMLRLEYELVRARGAAGIARRQALESKEAEAEIHKLIEQHNQKIASVESLWSQANKSGQVCKQELKKAGIRSK